MRASKVKIENPVSGESEFTSVNRARRFVDSGRAVFVGARAIRFTSESRRAEMVRLIAAATEARVHRELTGAGYDREAGSFYQHARAIPIISPEKMIREERSERDWSYAKAVRRSVRRDQTAEEVAAMRGAARR